MNTAADRNKCLETKVPLAREGQSLLSHLKGVAFLAKNFAKVVGLGYIAYVCGILHDLGKYSAAFKKYLKRAFEGESTHRGDVRHAWQGALAVLEAEARGDISAGQADLMANIVASHHGGLTDMIVDSERFLPLHIQELSRNRVDEHLSVAELPEMNSLLRTIDWTSVKEEFDDLIKKTPKQPYNRHLAVKFIYSCLIDADRCDAAGQKMDSTFPDWDAMECCLNAKLDAFSDQLNTSPLNAVRASISDQCATQADRAIGVFTLSVPTGGGKTLSSLRFAIRHARANGLKRIIYVIPYLSIIDQTAHEFREIFGNNADSWILEHHSNFLLESDEEDDLERYELGTQRWDAPIVLTTMVQFLETIASNRASDLRKFHNMTESVFIFDEVQALPVHCIHLFTQTVNFLSTIGKSSVVLCTATQPHLNTVERPIRLSDSPSLVSLDESQRKLFKRTNLVNLTWENGKERTFTCEEIAAFAQCKIAEGLSTLVILNTKSEAKAVFSSTVVSKAKKFFLSTNLCPAHRLDVLSEIRTTLKAREKHPEDETPPVLCVSTQLVEAGVDVSFDCVIRAEAGLDSIVQAAGRCNRHGKSPKQCDVFVVRVADDEERLANLPDIQCGKDITDRVLNREYPGDLGSALDKYYDNRFNLLEQKSKMDCPVWTTSKHSQHPDNSDGTILDWLGLNRCARQAYKNAHNGKSYPGLATAFQTAAEHFSVIEGYHIGVVVPYKKPGQESTVNHLVGDFLKTRNWLKEARDSETIAAIFRIRSRILRRLQQYTISIYANQESAIKEVADLVDDTFYFLSPAHYDSVLGLIQQKGFLSV
ncbi:MAG: CRISPR-associated helicase Cas3' [Kiritimatiellae bacterium]|nr:CRISPR-associated helicase Cas3' [Kiritimatiellia bacterium]